MAKKMTSDEIKSFLSAGTRTAKVATVSPDGIPHVVPVWFTQDGDDIIFTTGDKAVKAQHLQNDPHVAISVDDENPPYSFVMIRGTVKLSRNDPDLLKWSIELGRRYMGDDLAEQFGKRNAVPEELLVRVTPTKIVAIKNMTD